MPQYTYSKLNGSRLEKQESPLEPGVFLQPANSVDSPAPPTFDSSTHEAIWSDETNTWTVKKIYIGGYNSQEEEDEDIARNQITEETVANIDVNSFIRGKRNALLAETDIFATISVDGPAMPESVKTYRQALRDLPSNVSNPSLSLVDGRIQLNNVTWPNVPQEVLDKR